MNKARLAQREWARLSVNQRCRSMRRLRSAIAADIDQIVAIVSEEVGKPPMDVLTGDVMVTLEQLRFYEDNSSRILRARSIGKPSFFFAGTRFIEWREPHGVALIFAPWNYPFQLSLVPMATALFAGNAVVLKCSERTPGTAALIVSLCRNANLPDNLVQVSWERPEDAAALIDARPDLIFFTGSGRNGQDVAKRAASHLIPSVLELGGKDPCLVFASCDLSRAIEGAVYGAFSNAGQVCVGTKRIYVEEAIYPAFLKTFVDRTQSLRVGRSLDSDLGPIQFAEVGELLSKQVIDALDRGATLHTPWDGRLDLLRAQVLTDVPSEALLLTEEAFGPVVCIAPFRDEEEAIRLANSTPYALSASIFIGDVTQGERLAKQLNSGTCAINDTIRNIGNPQASFGGNYASGNGRYHGSEGLRTFSRTKVVMTAFRAHGSEIHWFPFTSRTFSRLRKLLLFRHAGGSLLKRLGKMFLLLFASGLVSSHALGETVSSAPLWVDIDVNRNGNGGLVSASPGGVPDERDKAIRHGLMPIATVKASHYQIDLGPLPVGRHAIAFYLDLNGNHRLDQGLLGIPKEPVGVSNNPKRLMGTPRFDECSFIHDSVPQVIPSSS
jgi:4,4'-diapolycopenoate synthase